MQKVEKLTSPHFGIVYLSFILNHQHEGECMALRSKTTNVDHVVPTTTA
jgi:hypothetical protein